MERFKKSFEFNKTMSEDIPKPFIDIFKVTMDSKNRIVVPAEYRRIIAGRNSDAQTSIYLVTDERMGEKYLAAFDQQGLRDSWPYIENCAISRSNMEFQGRIIVPERCLEHSGLEQSITNDVIVAASPSGGHFEIWKKERFDKGYKICIPKIKIWEL